MDSKLLTLIQMIGWYTLVEKAKRVANSVASRHPPNDVTPSNAMRERQMDVLFSGLSSRCQRYKESDEWGFIKILAFKYSLRTSLKKIGFTEEFATMASQRIVRF